MIGVGGHTKDFFLNKKRCFSMFFSRGGRDNGAERNNGETGEHSTSKVGHNIAGLIIGPKLIYDSQHTKSKI